jgi:peptide deformylase
MTPDKTQISAKDMNVLISRQDQKEYFPLLVYPNKGLRVETKEVTDFGPAFQAIIDKMTATMYRAQGVGLAAPQVGINAKVFILDCPDEGNNGLQVFVNPEIITATLFSKAMEGCLSFPGVVEQIDRASSIVGKAQDRFGNPFTFASLAEADTDVIKLSEVEVVAVQHEIEHLQGILMIDKVSHLKQRYMKKTVQKVLKSL